MVSKITERKRLKKVIADLEPEYRRAADYSITEKLKDFLSKIVPQEIGIYLNRFDEVSTQNIYDWLINEGWTVYAPRVESGDLHFYQIGVPNSKIVFSRQFNTWEPHILNPKAKKFSIIIVPLLGYGENNYRLGRGGGHYDRWLGKNRPQIVIGLGYKEQVVSHELRFNSQDFPLTTIITNHD